MDRNLIDKTFILVSIMLLSACNPGANISVSNVNDTRVIPGGAWLYALPQTVIDVTVYAEEVTVIPGPFHEYANKYLSIEHAPAEEEKIWAITKINLNLHKEVDPDYVYSLDKISSPDQNPEIGALIEDSLIFFPSDFANEIMFYNTLPERMDDIHYFDLSVKRNFDTDSDVDVSIAMPGAGEAAPLTPTVVVEKTHEQKAEEAANFIIKLRKRRFKLVAGQYDYMPEGLAMIEALKQLNKTEEEYLALFTGRRIVRERIRTFHFVPGSYVANDRNVLFRFSENEGFINASEDRGTPVLLELNNSNQNVNLAITGPTIRQKNNFIIYRIPDMSYARILYGEEIVLDAYLPVFQYGRIVTLQL